MNKPLPFPGTGRQPIHLLIDPDKWRLKELRALIHHVPSCIGTIIVGGSFIHSGGPHYHRVIGVCLESGRPVGTYVTAGPIDCLLDPRAAFVVVPMVLNALTTRFITDHLFQVVPVVERYRQPLFTMAYVQLDGGVRTAAQFFTQTEPLPRHCLQQLYLISRAAELFGTQGIYLEAGSGAKTRVLADEVRAARRGANGLPIIVGGGIHQADACRILFRAGAKAIVVGTAMEQGAGLDWLRRAKLSRGSGR